jgi:hypothetical protein
MDDAQNTKSVEYLWTSNPLDSEATVREWPPLPVLLVSIVDAEPRCIRDVKLKVGVIIQLVTTSTLKRGYITRGVNDYLLCEIESQEDSQEATLTFVGVRKILDDADVWIAEVSQ